MSGEMRPLSFEELLASMLCELKERNELFGIPRHLLYTPQEAEPFGQELFGNRLGTPVGPAAGPHTQLAQNIVSSWACGGRFIELKTVQILDELDIPRPCIDMEDEGYNAEWSQELKLEASAEAYIQAWVLIHLLPKLLDFPKAHPETIFNMSVGYNLEGVRSPTVRRFMDRLHNASQELEAIRAVLEQHVPELARTPIPHQLTNNVTLSTMHGCPPDEIEAIARYLLEERGLHTFVKLNPTLLGQDEVMRILHDELGYRDIQIPDKVFTHDLQYEQALGLVERLQKVAQERGLYFGVKLSNTLPTANHRGVLPDDDLYMSGRPLYPITMRLFHRLMEAFDGKLEVSYAAGADAENVTTVLACGARTVTAASDLLKPGGYTRLGHWLDTLRRAMCDRNAGTLEAFAQEGRKRLAQASRDALKEQRYHRSYYPGELPKVDRELAPFDCVVAPCVARCAISQDIPEYAWWIAQGKFDKALEVILHRNPMPGVTGYVCNHLCQTRCTRINYDRSVQIRALKRFADERGRVTPPRPAPPTGKRVAVIGAGPSGLASAYYLALSGVAVTVYERRNTAGGWPAVAPQFRLPEAVVQSDVERIKALGVEFRLGEAVKTSPSDLLKQGYDAVYLACGFQKDAKLDIQGEDAAGVWGALDLLERVAEGETPDLGARVLVVGGGNTAMDAARTAQRLTGNPVTVVYRRTTDEMPADEDELDDLLVEGNQLLSLLSPRHIVVEDGRVVALECLRNELGEPDSDGRRRPVPVSGSEHQLPADTVILAIGQRPDVSFLNSSDLRFHDNGRAYVDPATGQAGEGVFAGGDLTRGPATIVEACADGRRAAEAICQRLAVELKKPQTAVPHLSDDAIAGIKKARSLRGEPHTPDRLPAEQRSGFELVEQTLSEEAAQAEAHRCLQCATLCDKCVEVCPNRANTTYFVTPTELQVPVLACRGNTVEVVAYEHLQITQRRQILHVHDHCNECGNCATFCVHQGRPFVDKPRLFLRWEEFLGEQEHGLFISGNTMSARDAGNTVQLTVHNDGWTFEDSHVRVELARDLGVRSAELRRNFPEQRSLRQAAELTVIMDGIRASAPHVLT